MGSHSVWSSIAFRLSSFHISSKRKSCVAKTGIAVDKFDFVSIFQSLSRVVDS